jgi:hypothetical protein
MDWRRGTGIVAASVALAGLLALWPADAAARGRRGVRRAPAIRVLHLGGLYGAGPYVGDPYYGFGYGFGPFWPPYEQRPEGGIDPNIAMLAGWGAVDLNVKPNRAEVWVDGKYVAEARDLDGSPRFLWLPEGEHRLMVRKGGYVTFEAPIEIERGVVKELKLRMKRGAAASEHDRIARSR